MVEEVPHERASPAQHYQQIQFSKEEIEGKEAVVVELAGEKIKMGTASEEGFLRKKVTVVLPDRTEKTYILKTVDLVDKLGLSREEIEELDDKTLGAVITERARKQLSRKTDLILSFEKVGIASKNAKSLAEGILAKEKEWKENFDGFREKYMARQGEDADTLYLSKKDTGLPLSLEMNRDGAIQVLLRSLVEGEYKLKVGGTFKAVKTAYDIDKDKVLAHATINLSNFSMFDEEIEKMLTEDLQKELMYLEKYGGIRVSPLTFHKSPIRDYPGFTSTKATFTLELAAGTFENIKDKSLSNQMALFSQVATALERMHADGVVHRDIKPENLLVIADRGYLYDFGSAGKSDDISAEKSGTPTYLAPEYYTLDEDQKKYRKEADVWALGASIYVSLTGKDPPDGREVTQEDIGLVLRESFENQELLLLLEGMLTVDPEERISMDQVVVHFARITHDLEDVNK